MMVIVSGAAVEVSGARQRCRWQGSAVAVLSIPPLRHASVEVVLRVGVILRSRVVPSALMSFVSLGCSH
jgi:hypothetical protein